MDDFADYLPGESSFDWQGALSTAGKVFGEVAGAVGSFYTAKQNLTAQREANALKLQQSQFANTLALTQASGAVEITKARTAAEIAKAQREATGTTYIPIGGGGLSMTTIALLIGGIVVAMKFAR